MKLNIIHSAKDLPDAHDFAEKYLNCELRILRCKMSVFEQYEIRPAERKFIPKIWTYRIVVSNGMFNFGTVD